MLVNEIKPVPVEARLCVHCEDENKTIYLIAGPQQGKTTETVRQAVFRKATILSTDSDHYRSCGMKHLTEARPGEVSYIGLAGLIADDFTIDQPEVHMCIDNAKAILEQLLSERFKTKVIIDFMSLEG